MSDSPMPTTPEGVVKWFIAGTIVFALGFEGIAMLMEGKFLLGAVGIGVAVIILTIMANWPSLPGLALALILGLPVLFLGTVDFCKRRKFRPQMLVLTGIALVVIAFIALAVGGALVYVGAMNAETTATPPKQPSAPLRSKREINELLEESGLLYDIVQKTAVPLVTDLNTHLGAWNPQRICLGEASHANELSGFVSRMHAVDDSITKILDQNKIDSAELDPLLSYQSRRAVSTIPAQAAMILENYQREIAKLGEKPTCDDVVRSEIWHHFFDIKNAIRSTSDWASQAESKLREYRENLRKELRSVP